MQLFKTPYQCSLCFVQRDETTLEVTELPIRKWTQDYKEFLETLIKPEDKTASAVLEVGTCTSSDHQHLSRQADMSAWPLCCVLVAVWQLALSCLFCQNLVSHMWPHYWTWHCGASLVGLTAVSFCNLRHCVNGCEELRKAVLLHLASTDL